MAFHHKKKAPWGGGANYGVTLRNYDVRVLI
jgi:hypothetical protein